MNVSAYIYVYIEIESNRSQLELSRKIVNGILNKSPAVIPPPFSGVDLACSRCLDITRDISRLKTIVSSDYDMADYATG